MLNNKINIFEDVLIIGGISISISMIQSILGIIILSFQIALILYKGVRNLMKLIKKKEYDKIEESLKDTTEQLEHLSDKTKDGK